MAIGKILCLGDSLTAGLEHSPTGYRSYRGPLQKRLSDAGYTVDFVGTVSDPPASGGTDGDHNGYGGARMDSSDSADNSIEGRVSTIRTALGAVDIIVLLIGWNDVYSNTSSAATKYADLLNTIQSGDWAGAKILMVTLSPEPNKTPAQTGSDYANYSTINGAVRGAATSTRKVADIAALTTGGTADRDAMVEKLLYDAANVWDVTTDANGNRLPSVGGGHFITSFKSIEAFNANWRRTVAERRGMNSFTSGLAESSDVIGHPAFVNGVRALVPWFWLFAGPGHNSSNTVVEVRHLFAQALRGSNGNWEFFFEGARLGVGNNSAVYGSHSQVLRGFRDGITSYYRTGGSANIESWAEDTVPSRSIVGFYGSYNRSLMADAVAFCVGCQVRLALLDPSGPNDISQSRFVVACGFDAFVGGQATRYDYWGWPLDAMDGGHDRWQILRATDWTALGSIPMDRGSGHYEDPATPPPHAYQYSEGAYPYNDYPTYSKSATQIRANPPRLPQYWSGTGSAGSASAWTPACYWYNPSLGGLDIHWSQQGAELAARGIFDALVQSGFLDGFGGTGGGGGEPVIISPLPGLPARGAWFDRFIDEGTTPDTVTWTTLEDGTATTAPSWGPATSIAPATAGAAYTGSAVASGVPTPTHSIVSASPPAWLTYSSAGSFSGTAPASAQVYTLTLRATNSAGSADVTVALAVVDGALITTTSLPNAVQGVAYSQPLAATGVEPFAWSVISGSLPTGLALAGPLISGTPSGSAGTASFTVQMTDALGRTDTQALSITVGASSAVPVITTTTLPAGTIGVAYSQTIAVTGTGTITRAVVSGALAPGLSLNPTTGAVTGTPTASGGFGLTVRATGDYGYVEQTYYLIIAAGASEPVASPWARFARQ